MNPDIMETAYVLQVSESNLDFLVSIKFGIFGFRRLKQAVLSSEHVKPPFQLKNARGINPPAKGLKSATFT